MSKYFVSLPKNWVLRQIGCINVIYLCQRIEIFNKQ